jgi:predicted alpha/beta-fold hydrolase
LTVTRYGGHCGFLEKLAGPTWVERRIVSEFEAATLDQARPALRESA